MVKNNPVFKFVAYKNNLNFDTVMKDFEEFVKEEKTI